ncbi:serine-rich adhesin for platelets-like isoform X1 [Penaeus japonicus]|uniref:serine-rich adhesin for platelets-like isoform X1 n=1 Tax=Penaeus japonicus TaxID=27405 RepID=UPI001C712071|nr:serine-rich adhesin for platelets-like isoform X1 [Penaeus japonicus]XP_042871415.1 serine-rich adhesin for platelets-like isoform X1 [Penaeus japonicus]XP_042871416.1 serine-rich adhesin for platelets-like isoform X1 [Penaeus japonicus]
MLVENSNGGGGEGRSSTATTNGTKAATPNGTRGPPSTTRGPPNAPRGTTNGTTNGTSSSSSSSSSRNNNNGVTKTTASTPTKPTPTVRTTSISGPPRTTLGSRTGCTPGPAFTSRASSHVTTITKTSISSSSSSSSRSISSSPGSKGATPSKSASGGLEAQLTYTPPHVLIRSISSLSQHSLRPATPELDQEDGIVSVPALRKGVLLQARDRLFSRWKERYFVLTRDYLACFRRGSTKYSEMGSFIFKVNLASVECVEWQDRRGGPALALALPREGRVLLRAKSGLDQWYRLLLEATNASRHRRNVLRRGTSTTHLNNTTNNNLDLTPPSKSSGIQYSLSGSTPEITRLCDSVCDDSPGGTSSRLLTRHHRFSLLADPDLGSCDTDIATPPSSVTSSNKFSTSTSASNTSGSGGSSSLASSPSLRGSCAWPRPSSPLRPVVGDAPRSRLSLYEGARELPTSAKMRHSVCLEPRDAQDMARKQKNRHSICVEPRDLARTRASLCLEPRNPLLDLMESVEAIPTLISHEDSRLPSSARTSPSKSEGDRRSTTDVPLLVSEVDTSPSPSGAPARPRAHSTSLTPERTLGPRSRSNLGFFRHSGLFNH